MALVQTFVNTAALRKRGDELESPAEMRRWLVHRGLLDGDSELTPEDHSNAIRAREALRALLAANRGGEADSAAVGGLEELLAGMRFELSSDTRGPASFEPASQGIRQALGKLLAIVVAARNAGSWLRLKVCADPECGAAFFDTSGKAKWCSKRCGDRMRARTFRRSRKGRRR